MIRTCVSFHGRAFGGFGSGLLLIFCRNYLRRNIDILAQPEILHCFGGDVFLVDFRKNRIGYYDLI